MVLLVFNLLNMHCHLKEKSFKPKAYTFPKPLGKMEGVMVEIDVPPHHEISKTTLELAITKVNGQPNSASIKNYNLSKTDRKESPSPQNCGRRIHSNVVSILSSRPCFDGKSVEYLS